MINANFMAYGSYRTDSLYQWDKNRILSIQGIDITVSPEIHFANAEMDRAIVVQGKLVDGVLSGNIPNSLLQSHFTIRAYIGVYSGSTFKTLETVEIPVIARAKPSDYVLQVTDEEVYSFRALENKVNNAIAVTNEKVSNALSEVNSKCDKAVEDVASTVENAVADLDRRVSSIVAHNNDTSGNTELVDIRSGINGATYETAGDHVRHLDTLYEEVVEPTRDQAVENKNNIQDLKQTNVVGGELDGDALVFFNSLGVTLFTIDVTDLGSGSSAVYGELELSNTEIAIDEGMSNSFTVKLSSAPSGNQIVYIAVSDPTKIQVEPTSLTFNASNYSTPQTVNVVALEDEDGNDESEIITLTSRKVTTKQIAVAVADNDVALIDNGMIMLYDFTSMASGVARYTDEISGVTIDNLNHASHTLTPNGLIHSGSSYTAVPFVVDSAFTAFVTKLNDLLSYYGSFTLEFYGSFIPRAIGITYPGNPSGNSLLNCSVIEGSKIGTNATIRPHVIINNDGTATKTDLGFANVSGATPPAQIDVTITNGVCEIFINGELINSEVFSTDPYTVMDLSNSSYKLSQLISFSNKVSDTSEFISAISMYDRVLTPEEMKKNVKAHASKLSLTNF